MSILSEKVKAAARYFIPGNVPAERAIWNALDRLGIVDDDISYELLMSENCKEGDARAVFCDQDGLPVPRFRKIWSILKDDSSNQSEPRPLTAQSALHLTPIGQWSDKDLLERYSPTCPMNVMVELKSRSELKPCVVFDDGGKVDTEQTLKLLRLARRKGSPTIPGARLGKVYRVGEFPCGNMDLKCPVTRQAMRGERSVLGVDWDIPYEAMQFVAVMVDNGLSFERREASEVIATVKQSGLGRLRELFPTQADEYDRRAAEGSLPDLTLSSATVQK